jgi:hypothetical protein
MSFMAVEVQRPYVGQGEDLDAAHPVQQDQRLPCRADHEYFPRAGHLELLHKITQAAQSFQGRGHTGIPASQPDIACLVNPVVT